MKSIKTATQNIMCDVGKCINEIYSPIRNQLNKKWKLQVRIRLANRWARQKPRRIMIAFLIAMGIIICTDILVTSLISKDKKSEMPIESIMSVENVFNGLRKIENNRENIRQYYSQLVADGTKLTNQLDSINRIEHKTHKDSLELKRIMDRLNIISNILFYEEN